MRPAVSSAPPLSLPFGSDPQKYTSIPGCTDPPPSKHETSAHLPAGRSRNPCSTVGSDEWLRTAQRVPAPRVSFVSWFAPAIAPLDRVDTLASCSLPTLLAAATLSTADSRTEFGYRPTLAAASAIQFGGPDGFDSD